MIYKSISLNQAIAELYQIQINLRKIKDDPLITSALEDIKKATEKLSEVEKAISDHLEEHR